MRKILFLLIGLSPIMAYSQAAEETTANLSKISTGLSIALIFLVGIVALLLYQKEKLIKRNKELSETISKLQGDQ